MTTFAGVSELQFLPRASVSLDSAGVQHTTPSPWRKMLGGLANIGGTRSELKYSFDRPDGSGTATVTLTLKTATGAVLGSESIDLPPSVRTMGKITTDVGGVAGGQQLLCEVEVTTADATFACDFDAVLNLETPVIVGGC